MVLKLHELTDDKIGELNKEELIENLKGARDGWHKSKTFIAKNGLDDADRTYSQEELEARVQEELEKKNFLESHSDLSDEHIEKLEKIREESNVGYDDALTLLKSRDENLGNQVKTLGSRISGDGQSPSSPFTGKLNQDEYSQLSSAEKDAYAEYSKEEFGGFALDLPQGVDEF